MKNLHWVCGLAIGLLLSGAAIADLHDVDSVKAEARTYNDFPESDLTETYNFPSMVSWVETGYKMDHGGWANMHEAWLSSDGGATRRGIATDEGFDFGVDAYLDAGSVSPRKEAGIRATTVFGDALFIITSDGEVAAFGGNWPFYSFGKSAYNLGETVRMGVVHDAVNKTLTYYYNGHSSGPLNFASDGDHWTDGGNLGLYGQFAVDHNNTDEYGDAEFGNLKVVPEPTSIGLLALAGLVAFRRR